MQVSSFSWNRIVGLFMVIAMSMIGIPACETEGSVGDESFADGEEAALMPNEVWIADAELWLDSQTQSIALYKVFTSQNSGREYETFFDSVRTAYRTRIALTDGGEDNYFFDTGRLIYSIHNRNEEGEFLMAYANNEPFAAAWKKDDSWVARKPSGTWLAHFEYKNVEIVTKALQVKEKGIGIDKRIIVPRFTANSRIEKAESQSYYLNAMEGDFVKISINSAPADTYFTINVDNGSKMEHTTWSGTVNKTGDVKITVFTVSKDDGRDYILETERINRQIPA